MPETTQPSALERIEQMKRRLAEAKARQDQVAARKKRLDAAVSACASRLLETLQPLAGLPVRDEGGTGVVRFECPYPFDYVDVRIDGDGPPLVGFVVACDPDTEDAWVEHDDTRVSVEVALEIATDIVERHLAVPGEGEDYKVPF